MNKFFCTIVLSLVIGGGLLQAQTDSLSRALIEEASRYWGASMENSIALLKAGAKPNAADADGLTAAHHAVLHNYNMDFLQLLYYYGAKFEVRDKAGKTPLDFVYMQDSSSVYVQFFKKPVLDLLFYCNYGTTADIKKYITEHPKEINVPTEWGFTPLYLACRREKDGPELAKFMLEKGADVNPDFLNLMDISIDTENKELVQAFLAQRKDTIPATPLCYAADKQNFDLVKILVEAGAEINPVYEDYIPLDWACGLSYQNWETRRMKPEIVEYLIDKGADVNAGNPLWYASQALNSDTILQILFKKGAKADKALVTSAERNNPSLFKQAIAGGANINATDEDGKSVAAIVAEDDRTELLQMLADAKADFNKPDENGNTPLHFAVKSGSLNAVVFLQEHGAQVERKNNFGTTPTMLAVCSKHIKNLEITKLLIDKGASLKASNFFKTENKNCPYLGSYTAAAAYYGNINILKYLIEEKKQAVDTQGFDPISNTNSGKTPFQCAMENKKTEAMTYLLEKGANPNQTDANGKTALIFSMDYADNTLFTMLIQKGANVNVIDASKNSPLHIAVKNQIPQTVEKLLSGGAAVNSQNADGNTPLHIAVATYNTNIEIINMLKKAGASNDIKNNLAQTPVDVLAYLNTWENIKNRIGLAMGIEPNYFEGNALVRNKLTVKDWIPFMDNMFSESDPEHFGKYYKSNNIHSFDFESYMLRKFKNGTQTIYADYNPYPMFDSNPPLQTKTETLERLGFSTDTVYVYDEGSGEQTTLAVQNEGTPDELTSIVTFDNWNFNEKDFIFEKTTEAYAPVRRYYPMSDDYFEFRHKKVGHIVPEPLKNERKREKELKNAILVKQVKYETPIEKTTIALADESVYFVENENAVFLNSFVGDKLRSIIFDAAISGRKPVYDFNTGARVMPSEIGERMGEKLVQTYDFDPETGDEIPIMVKLLMVESEVKSLIFIEDWYLDTTDMHIFKEVIGVAPVRTYFRDGYESDMSMLVRSIPFVLYFKPIESQVFSPKPMHVALPIKYQEDLTNFSGFSQDNLWKETSHSDFDWAKAYREKALKNEITLYYDKVNRPQAAFTADYYAPVEKTALQERFNGSETKTDIKTVGVFSREIWNFDRQTYAFSKDVYAYTLFSSFTHPEADARLFLTNGYVLNTEKANPAKMTLLKTVEYELNYDDYYKYLDAPEAEFEVTNPLFFSNFNNQNLKDMILEDARSGKIQAFHPETAIALTVEELEQNLVMDSVEIETVDDITGEFLQYKQAVLASGSTISALRFTEEWYIDTETLNFKKVVTEIAPIIYNFSTEAETEKPKKIIPFVIHTNSRQ